MRQYGMTFAQALIKWRGYSIIEFNRAIFIVTEIAQKVM